MAVQDDQLFDPEVQHSLVKKIPNKSTKSKARASLPDILYLKEVYGKIGIFTNGFLPKATQFGPLEAPLATKNQMDEPDFPMKLDIRKCRRLESSASSYVYYDTTDENMCNWMMLVQPANVFSEQNLCAYQNEDFVYFTTTKEIQPHEELRVWYSPTYARFMSAGILTPSSGAISVPKVNPGRQKPKKSKSTRRMQVYPNSMVLERDVRSIPPKKRGWKRTKRMDAEMPSIVPPPSATSHHEPIKKKNLTCEICHKTFKDSTKLKVHSVVHSTARNFLCHHCGATYKRKDKLREHELRIHEGINFRRSNARSGKNLENYEFKCEECEVGFRRRGMLISHIMKRHPGADTDTNEQLNRPVYKIVRKFQCPYCNKVYKSNTKRKSHVRKHHPSEPLPQSLKRKKCDTTEQGDNGIITEPPIKMNPFSCQYCTMEYSMKHKLDKHIRDKHPEFYQGSTSKRTKCLKPSLNENEQAQTDSIGNHSYEHQGTAAGSIFELPRNLQCAAPFSTPSELSAHTISLEQHQEADVVERSLQKGMNTTTLRNNQIQPAANQSVVFSYTTDYEGLLRDQMLARDSVPIQGGFEDCRTLETSAATPSNMCDSTPRTVNDIFGNTNAPLTPLSHELPTADFLNRGPPVMETEQAIESREQQTQQQYSHTNMSKTDSHYRYHCGRKRILRYYEDSQNQQMQSQNTADTHFARQLSLKGRELNNETFERTAWLNEHRSEAIVDVQPQTNNGTIFSGMPFTNERAQSCAISTRTTMDAMLVDNQRLPSLRSWNDNGDSILMTTSRNLLFESEAT